ncbi:hypothetical protein DM02DRAFT_632801 [Periconia macrospinosa]|uniref:Uncharacterized protein n=1 Tax=Periconia macrospinosa TaxID=97972 RepID=A0A2V1DEI6_9PLEO|nr:hypothetical protein DM02DRAFT_632801 [Periconia macrospinosa]
MPNRNLTPRRPTVSPITPRAPPGSPITPKRPTVSPITPRAPPGTPATPKRRSPATPKRPTVSPITPRAPPPSPVTPIIPSPANHDDARWNALVEAACLRWEEEFNSAPDPQKQAGREGGVLYIFFEFEFLSATVRLDT